jgi:hypothetical protein
MHNMDRILNEEFEEEYGFLNESEWEDEGGYGSQYESEWEGNFENAYEEEWEGNFENAYEEEWEGGFEQAYEEEWEEEYEDEQDEYELAAELLSVTNEEELDQFLGKLFRRVGRGLSKFAKSGLGRTLIGGLKSVARTALPIAGKAVGSVFGGPIGGALGGKLGGMASQLFEIQSEGMSNEDLEFEIARRYVRFAKGATRKTISNARKIRAGGVFVPARKIVSNSLKSVAAVHAPGLLTAVSPGIISPPVVINTPGAYAQNGSPVQNGGGTTDAYAQTGSWERQGDQIIVHGA